MSVQATTWVWSHSRAEGTARLVLLAIADAANREGERAWISANTLASMCRIGHRTAQRKVAEPRGVESDTRALEYWLDTVYRRRRRVNVPLSR